MTQDVMQYEPDSFFVRDPYARDPRRAGIVAQKGGEAKYRRWVDEQAALRRKYPRRPGGGVFGQKARDFMGRFGTSVQQPVDPATGIAVERGLQIEPTPQVSTPAKPGIFERLRAWKGEATTPSRAPSTGKAYEQLPTSQESLDEMIARNPNIETYEAFKPSQVDRVSPRSWGSYGQYLWNKVPSAPSLRRARTPAESTRATEYTSAAYAEDRPAPTYIPRWESVKAVPGRIRSYVGSKLPSWSRQGDQQTISGEPSIDEIANQQAILEAEAQATRLAAERQQARQQAIQQRRYRDLERFSLVQ